ncbi:MAG: TetR/AcrR family transcriptional regulator [Candidatus Marinimicrobia bacterium]|nr:TetR/AcrR family transcriptional regulator [Candidatus Neomarinimicrobiota bacterium]
MPNFSPRQQEIIEAAIAIIAENGIQFLTIKNLAKKINVTEGAIYRHFTNKLEILNGILDLFQARANANFSPAVQDSSAMENLHKIIHGMTATFVENPAISAVIFSEEIFQNHKQLSDTVFSIMSNNLNTIEQIIQTGCENGEIRTDIPARQLAILIMGGMRLTVNRWRLSGHSNNLLQAGEQYWQTVKKILSNP